MDSLFKSNFASGLVVFLVALPLCLGIALASGAPPLSGVLAGIVIGSLSTSHISVSGSAAGLVATILAAIAELGSFELFLCAGLMAGAIQLLLGFVRAGSLAEYIPVSVIEGMLAGIGVIIIMKQIPFALGSSGSLADPAALFADIHTGSLLVACVSMAILIVWDKIPALKNIKALPATLAAVVALDLLEDVGIGLAISIIFIFQGNMKRAYYLSREEFAEADEISLELAEEVSFLNKAAIKKTLKNIHPGSKVTINAERSSYIAGDVLELIEDFANVFSKENDIDVVLKGFKSDYDHEGRDHHSHVRVGHSASI